MLTRRQRALAQMSASQTDQSPSYSEESSPLDSIPSLSPPRSTISPLSSESFPSTNTTIQAMSSHSEGATPSVSPIDESAEFLKSIQEKAKAVDMDPTLLMFAQLLTKQTTNTNPAQLVFDKPDSLASAISRMSEDVFVFLHRFEYELTRRRVHQNDWLSHLPSVLSGNYKEAYYNNVSVCTTYVEMKIVMLNIGGYSISECLNSYPLKFRASGHKSMLQWFNNWKYKFQVILESLPFLVHCNNKLIEDMSNLFATVGLLAGMPQEHRDAVLNKPCQSNQLFIQECNTWYLSSVTPHNKPTPHKSYQTI